VIEVRNGARTRLIGILALLVGALVAGPLARGSADAPALRLVAVGDVHGDHDALLDILERAAVASRLGRWTGGTITFVQMGDFLDLGAKVPEVLDLLMSLELQAPPEGGRTVVLMGNHEAMNLIGEFRDVAPELYARFADDQSEARREAAFEAHRKLASRQRNVFSLPPSPYREPDRDAWMAAHPPGLLEYREALGPESRYGRWLRERPAVVKVGDTILVHGGIAPELAPKRLEDINRQVSRELETFDRVVKMMVARGLALPFFTLQELFDVARAHVQAVRAAAQDATAPPAPLLGPAELAQMEELLRIGSWYLINPSGPLWFRGYATWTSSEGAKQLPGLLERYGASRFVVGHTPLQTMRITPRFSGQVFLIDTGMLSNHHPGGRSSALEIRGSAISAIYVDATVALAEGGPGAIQ
jgi:hypothetical protein